MRADSLGDESVVESCMTQWELVKECHSAWEKL